MENLVTIRIKLEEFEFQNKLGDMVIYPALNYANQQESSIYITASMADRVQVDLDLPATWQWLDFQIFFTYLSPFHTNYARVTPAEMTGKSTFWVMGNEGASTITNTPPGLTKFTCRMEVKDDTETVRVFAVDPQIIIGNVVGPTCP